jgi:small subunit ribosomal protein S16
MLMIRFQRIGRKNDPAFRMLVLEKTASPKAGTYVEQVGTYNPKTKAFSADADAIKGWIGKGAQVSPSLKNLLIRQGVLEGAKSAAVVKKKNLEKNIAKKAAEEAAAKEAADKAAAEAVAAEAVAAEPVEAVAEEAPAEVAEAAAEPEVVAEAEPVEAEKEETPTAA